ncbi:FAD-dependent oxidoreductase [Streptomyces sp. NPDC021098]|uniref:FAD-dependent oxidoreductase n=1 Tax=unclassified Streptomyces TaxID=2593676 RepID=UPI0037B34ED7
MKIVHGTGGYSTALRAAALGLRVVLAERDLIGGTCLHRGCVPSKAMLHAAELVDGIAEARERWGVKATLDAVDSVVTSDDALFAPGLPASVLVLGGGAIGVEYASLHRSMGARVVLVEAADRLLPLEDADVSRHLTRGLKKRGVEVLAGARLEGAERDEDGVRATVRTARGEVRELDVERLLIAVGRAPVTDGLDLAAAGIATDGRGFLAPADWSRLETAVPGVHAVGDVLPPPSPGLAHASFAEGLLVAETLAGGSPRPVDYDAAPRVTYSSPQTASVGLSEAEALDRTGGEAVANTMPLTAVAKGMVHGQGGMVKVVAERPGGRVLGVHLVGPHVSEMIAESQLVVGWDAEPADVAQHIHPHPTLSEAVGEAYLTLAGRGLHQR